MIADRKAASRRDDTRETRTDPIEVGFRRARGGYELAAKT